MHYIITFSPPSADIMSPPLLLTNGFPGSVHSTREGPIPHQDIHRGKDTAQIGSRNGKGCRDYKRVKKGNIGGLDKSGMRRIIRRLLRGS